MSTIAEPKTYTADEFLALPDRDRYELVDGYLVEQNVSVLSSLVGARLLRLISNHCEAHAPAAWTFGADCLYQCFPGHPRKVRKPDISLIHPERLSAEQLEEGFLTLPPDLAVEVVSPNDLAYEIEEKVREYLEAGVRLVWVVYPPTRTVHIRRGDGTIAVAASTNDLEGEGVVPGFRCRVGDLFPPLPTAGPVQTA